MLCIVTALHTQYQVYGEPVIRACIKEKCNYVDITGEPYVRILYISF